MRLAPLLAAFVLVLPTGAQARPDLDDALGKADLNGDGAITRGEFRDHRSRQFDRFDRDGDGYLSRDDLPRRARRAGNGGNGRMAEVVATFDRNRDGRLSHTEFVDGPTLAFDRADLDRDNRIDPAELRRVQDLASRSR